MGCYNVPANNPAAVPTMMNIHFHPPKPLAPPISLKIGAAINPWNAVATILDV